MLVKKLLHEPTMALKEQSKNGQAAKYAMLARELFGIAPSGVNASEQAE